MISGVYFQTSTPVPIRVPNSCDFASLKTRIHNTLQLFDKQFLDEIHYRKPFTDTGNQICFECMKLINDDDVNTMLMCNDQFSCVSPIELLCIVGRTPDGIINLLERTMPRTHDAILYYNGKWNMPPQNKFVGCAFTGKKSKRNFKFLQHVPSMNWRDCSISATFVSPVPGRVTASFLSKRRKKS